MAKELNHLVRYVRRTQYNRLKAFEYKVDIVIEKQNEFVKTVHNLNIAALSNRVDVAAYLPFQTCKQVTDFMVDELKRRGLFDYLYMRVKNENAAGNKCMGLCFSLTYLGTHYWKKTRRVSCNLTFVLGEIFLTLHSPLQHPQCERKEQVFRTGRFHHLV